MAAVFLTAAFLHLWRPRGNNTGRKSARNGGLGMRDLLIEGLLILAFIVAGTGLLFYLHKRELL
ncbi:hypothetical protein hamaS1_02070 [Moorella sp. Hama-1]|nr:hypothetical protein hamaS1_02070 [Moorella sp. Hama-1]